MNKVDLNNVLSSKSINLAFLNNSIMESIVVFKMKKLTTLLIVIIVSGSIFGQVPTHFIGELYQGGVVFLVDSTGNNGLICSMTDISTNAEWCNWIGVTGKLIDTDAQNDWDGMRNSNAIVNQIGHTNSAAKLCLDYTNEDYETGVYSDWYLPGRGELKELLNNFRIVQKSLESDGNNATKPISEAYYWSSSEYSGYFAWLFNFRFDNGSESFYDNKQDQFNVRAVRRFGEDTLVFKGKGKLFAMTKLDGELSINLKCDPERADEPEEL